MNFVAGCAECDRTSRNYESVTIEWFRVQNQLGIAEFLNDSEASARIVAELSAIARQRLACREAAECHIAQAHMATLAARIGAL